MKRLKRKWKVIHKIFREGTLTHSDGAGMVRIAFNKPTGGIRQRDVPADSFDVDPPPEPSAMLDMLSGGPVQRSVREEAIHCANEIWYRRKQCPDRTATERLHKEFLIGVLANDKRLQIRSWWNLMKVAVMAAGNLFHPDIPNLVLGKRAKPRDTFAFQVGNEMFVGWLMGKEKYPPRYFGRTVYNRCCDILRKVRTARRRQSHNLLNAPDMYDLFNTEDANGMYTTGKRWYRQRRSDVGKKRGRYKRKGEQQK